MSKNNLDFFQKDLDKKIKSMCTSIKINDELEVSFGSNKNPISLKCFHDLLNFLIAKSLNYNKKIINSITLDILYRYDHKSASTYRLTLSDIDKINNFIDSHKIYKNNTLFSKQIKIYKNQEDNNIILINKIKLPENFIELNEYNIRIKLSEEISDIPSNIINNLLNLDDSSKHNITFRYKQRYNLIIESNNNYIISIDLTDVKTNNNISRLHDINSQYELELDISFKTKINSKILDEVIQKMYYYIIMLEKFLQQSNILVTKTEINNVLKSLNKLAYDNENETYKDLPAMQVVSVEIHHIIDKIPGNYTITDKADGDRCFLMVYNDNIYLISNNLQVKKIKENVNSKHNLTVLDGEYLYLSAPYNKYLFLAFDIIFLEGKDIRTEDQIHKRLILLNKTLLELYNIELDIGYYEKEYNINLIQQFHIDNINKYLLSLIKNLKETKDNNVISGKYFIVPVNIGNQTDIYKLSKILYDTYTNGLKIKCPYVLDGIIYTPLHQKYTRSTRNTKYSLLKWKPEINNSIDFYIEFERDPITNKILNVFDKTINKNINADNNEDDFEENKNIFYQIANLYVGKVKNNQEFPILFQKENNNYTAYIIITDGFPRDNTGEIIQDKTVVEMTYDNISIIHDNFRWKPLRTRYDKTESVMRFKRKYGNNFDTADRIWNSIINPIKYSDIQLLADDKNISTHLITLKKRLNAELINTTRRDDEYYQLTTNIGKTMRTYINWIKSNIIYVYCSPKYNIKLDVLDIGVGRGGDINKFFHSRVKSLVGIDPNEAGIYSGSDGAISRYNTFKVKLPSFPKMTFIVANSGMKFDYNNQKSLGNLNEESIKYIKEIFGEEETSKKYSKFDIFNMQMMIHYLFENKNTFDNLCYNINKYLKVGGLILITVFDGNLIDKNFINGEIKKEYISEDGKNMLLYNIIKKYNNIISNDMSYENNLGNQIDMYNSMFLEEGSYITEYLVNPKFLIKEFKDKCKLKLVDTDLFHNMFHKYKDFFDNSAFSESKQQTNTFFTDVSKFYNNADQNNIAWYDWFKLFRYYIFMKID